MSDDSGKGKSDVLGKLVPLVTVLIAAGAFMFSVWQYRNQQEDTLQRRKLDQLITLQTQIRTDSDALSQFPKNVNVTISNAQSLLRDLDVLLNSRIDVEPNKKYALATDRRRISEILYTLVFEDCNFDVDREVEFSGAVFNNWPDYQEYLKTPEQRNKVFNLVLVKYIDAIEKLYDGKPDYIGRLKSNGESLVEPYRDPVRMRQFEHLAQGFEDHVELLNEDDKTKAIQLFHLATCNRPLTEARFGDFEPLPESWFGHCKARL
ncbi:MAG TPA: hypothetical protein VHQ64_20455 [Pyrinomonadaceae bacterium]|jgi:hypothetical protein|nr:hypothetical protein [Pyrinomonadaceae bacterium]